MRDESLGWIWLCDEDRKLQLDYLGGVPSTLYTIGYPVHAA
jgi:hypothetical protein